MRHFIVEITDLTGKHIWNIIAARSSDAMRIALRLATIIGPFYMVTRAVT